MVTFTEGYVEPGVYVESEIKARPSIGTVGNFVPVLVGTADAFKMVKSDPLVMVDNVEDYVIKLNDQAVPYTDIRSGKWFIIDELGYKYTEGSNFEVVDLSRNVAIRWVGKRPLPEKKFVVYFYLVKQPQDYKARFFYASNYEEAMRFLGDVEVDSDNNIKYSLPLGFKLAIENGASGVWCVTSSTDGGVRDIIDILDEIARLKNPDGTYPYTLVFLDSYVSGENDSLSDADVIRILNHVRVMSSVAEQKERIVIFGPRKGLDSTQGALDLYVQTLRVLKDKRAVYCCPSDIDVLVGNTVVTVDGYYLGAAIAGLIDSVPINHPLTGQLLMGILKVHDTRLRSEKNIIAREGGLIVEDNLRIRHALTTDQSNPITGELKITRIVDYTTRIVRSSLAGFVNQPYSAGLVATIAMSIKLILTQLANINSIVDYKDITISRNEQDPRQLDVSFSIRPTFDVNWIYVKFTVEI